MNDADTFLRALWSGKPEQTAIQLWRKSDHKTFSFANIEAAVDWVNGNGGVDVYMAAGLAAKANKPSKQRATKQTVVAIAGIWADIDVNGGPENKTGAASSLEAAQELAESVLQPTLIVNSGYGLQAWWLFEDGVWGFQTEAEREEGQKIVTGFQGALKTNARKHNFAIDSTFDLARLMRVPGSFNHKGASVAPVELLDDGGPRYSRSQLDAVGREFQGVGSNLRLLTGEAIQIVVDPEAEPKMSRIMQLMEAIPEFEGVWNHRENNKRKTWSHSEYEFSLTNYFVNAGWDDQEICNALVFHRNRFDAANAAAKNRSDRISLTIGKVRATTNHQAETERRDAERDQAANELSAIADEGGLDRDVTLSLFNRVLGGPEIKEFIQTGRDPSTTRYLLVLANGDEIPVGGVSDLLSQDRFREAMVAVSQFLPKRVKGEKWDDVVRALVSTATIRADAEDTRAHRAWEWVNSYAERRISSDRDMACQSNDPFTQHGNLYVPLGPLQQYLRKVLGERIHDPDLRGYLEAAGFERKTINYHRDDGKRSSRSYYVGPHEGSE